MITRSSFMFSSSWVFHSGLKVRRCPSAKLLPALPPELMPSHIYNIIQMKSDKSQGSHPIITKPPVLENVEAFDFQQLKNTCE